MAGAGSFERIRSLLSSTFGMIVVVVSHASELSRLSCDRRNARLVCDSDTLATKASSLQLQVNVFDRGRSVPVSAHLTVITLGHVRVLRVCNCVVRDPLDNVE